jgi:hypothetical protein
MKISTTVSVDVEDYMMLKRLNLSPTKVFNKAIEELKNAQTK